MYGTIRFSFLSIIRSTSATLNVTVPDTITAWVASAFIISENLGLGVIKMPVEVTNYYSNLVYF